MRYLSFFALVLFLGLTLTLATLSSSAVHAATYYVDDDTCPGQGSGTEVDPFCSIQSGINVASTGDIVQVAAGTYEESIIMKSAVAIQGAGQGVSIIDGGGSGSVVTAISVDSTATLDGFTITGGAYDVGGGIYNEDSSPTVTNCIFSGNSATWGGGIFNTSSSPTVTNCVFSGNTADYMGGGIYSFNSSPTVTNCTFSENTAAFHGGGMFNYDSSSPTVTNCSFLENTAYGLGGGMHNEISSPTVTNCTFSGNSANNGGGIFNTSSSPTVTNCIFSGNTTAFAGGGMFNSLSSPTLTNCIFFGNSTQGMFNYYSSSPTVTNTIMWGDNAYEIINDDDSSSPVVTYSNIQGGYTGTGNINADPLFLDPDGPDNVLGTEDDDLHLTAGSPCIDAGDNAAPNLPSTDIDGDNRRIDDPTVPDTGNGDPPIVDIGADEFSPEPVIDDLTFDQCISELCTSAISVTAHDPFEGNLTYEWEALNGGLIIGAGGGVVFEPPDTGPHACPYQVELTITSDASGLSLSQTMDIYVKLAGNVNGDGNVNVVDKVLVRNAFGQSEYPGWIDEDVNCDGNVNVVDKVLVRNQFGETSCPCP